MKDPKIRRTKEDKEIQNKKIESIKGFDSFIFLFFYPSFGSSDLFFFEFWCNVIHHNII